MELNKRNGTRSNIVVLDEKTYEGINSNVVLRDAIGTFGNIIYIRKRRIFSLLIFLGIYLHGFLGAKYIHFGLFNHGLLCRLWSIHIKNIYFSQSDSYKHNHLYYRKKIFNKAVKLIRPLGRNIIAFNDLMPELGVIDESKVNVYLFGETRTREIWMEYTKKYSTYYFEKYHQNLQYKNGYIVLILGPFCNLFWLKENDSSKQLFLKTLSVLKNNKQKHKVLIKPHVTTDLNIVRNAIGDSDQFEITYLHPSILAQYANCFIANLYSTTFADAYNIGNKTIEFTHYNDDLLNETNGVSVSDQYVSHFINNDVSALENVLLHILENRNYNKISITSVVDNDDTKLISSLCD